jgi:hypothetical protein
MYERDDFETESETEEPLNDAGHPMACSCPVCLPERYDPAELEAGRPERFPDCAA